MQGISLVNHSICIRKYNHPGKFKQEIKKRAEYGVQHKLCAPVIIIIIMTALTKETYQPRYDDRLILYLQSLNVVFLVGYLLYLGFFV